MLINFDWERYEVMEGVSCEVNELSFEQYQVVQGFLKKHDVGTKGKADFSSLSPEVFRDLSSVVLVHGARNLQGVQYQENGEIHDAVMEDIVQNKGNKVAFFLLGMKILTKVLSKTSLAQEELKGIIQTDLEVKTGEEEAGGAEQAKGGEDQPET